MALADRLQEWHVNDVVVVVVLVDKLCDDGEEGEDLVACFNSFF